MNKTLAIILDGEVVDVLQFDERMASILLSNPTIVDITSHNIGTGWQFDGNNFVNTIDGNMVVINPEGE